MTECMVQAPRKLISRVVDSRQDKQTTTTITTHNNSRCTQGASARVKCDIVGDRGVSANSRTQQRQSTADGELKLLCSSFVRPMPVGCVLLVQTTIARWVRKPQWYYP